jgi:hypothetical protein
VYPLSKSEVRPSTEIPDFSTNEIAIPPNGYSCYEPAMEPEETILADLRTSVQAALARAEARMILVDQQLSNRPSLQPSAAVLPESDPGWSTLEQTANDLANQMEQNLREAQNSLSEFLQFGRALQVSLPTGPSA